MLSVKNTINTLKLINSGDIIGCAVSGGSDSMALLYFLLQIKEEYGFNFVCLNVEHGIRGKESESDSLFVKRFCQKNNIKFIGKSVDVPSYASLKGENIEQAARILRYEFFHNAIKDGFCNKVFTAHNQKDNAETVILNIFRGSGAKGLCGIPVVTDKNIIRPMLYTPKSEILQYIKDNNIEYITDSTNLDNAYSRNYIRNALLPLIEQRFEGVYDNISRLCGIMSEENDYLDSLSGGYIQKAHKGYYINLPLHNVLLKRAAIICCKKLGVYADITSVNLKDIVRTAEGASGNMINIGKINVYKEYDKLYLESASIQKQTVTQIPFAIGEYKIGDYIISVKTADKKEFNINDKKKEKLFADLDKFDKNAVFRNKKDCDSFKRYGGGTKSLSDYLTDIKVPKRIRDKLPLICSGAKVLAVIPYDISEDVKIDADSRNIVKITYNNII